MDAYGVLGVETGCSDDEIKQAYRRLALRYHPDKNRTPKAEAKFKQINEAYAVLSDPIRRAEYDATVRRRAEGPPRSFEDLASAFVQMFRGGRAAPSDQFGTGSARPTINPWGRWGNIGDHHHSPAPHSPDTVIPISVDLALLFTGGRKSYSFKRQVECRQCAGSGAFSAAHIHSCVRCKGSGLLKDESSFGGFSGLVMRACSQCNGAGHHIARPCGACSGAGVSIESRSVTADISPGLCDGDTLVFPGLGDQLKGSAAPGRLVLEIHAGSHDVFTRNPADPEQLHCRYSISLLQALTGFTFEICALDGVWLSAPVSDVVHPRMRKVVLGEGMPRRHIPSQRGHLIVTFDVQFPHHLNQELKSYLRLLLSPQPPEHLLAALRAQEHTRGAGHVGAPPLPPLDPSRTYRSCVLRDLRSDSQQQQPQQQQQEQQQQQTTPPPPQQQQEQQQQPQKSTQQASVCSLM